jgi:hypothetical protein
MTPVSATGNVGDIGSFERQQRELRPDLSRRTIETGSAGSQPHQEVHTEYDPPAVLDRLIAPAPLAALSGGTPLEQSMAGAIRTQADFVPARQVREMATPGHATARHEMGLDQILGQEEGSYRYNPTSVRRGAGRFERAGRPTGDPGQYRTAEDPIAQRGDALLHADMMRTLAEDDPHRQEHRRQMEAVGRGERRLGYQQIEDVQRTATQDFPRFGSGLSAERQAAELAAEARRFAGDLPEERRGRGRRRSRSRSRSRGRSRSRSRSR